MPRTKRPVNKPEKSSERNENLSKLEKTVTGYKTALRDRGQMELKDAEMKFKILIDSIPKEYSVMTVGQLKSELILKDARNTQPALANGTTGLTGRSASHDDGYMTEAERSSQGSDTHIKKPAPPSSHHTSSRSRRSRSADPSRGSARKLTSASASRSHSHARTATGHIYRTPAHNRNLAQAYPVITPKVAPHAPLTLLRQPRDGEMVVSLTGSPVMVQTFNNMKPEEKANCNIRLADGTMLSLQPKNLRESLDMIPFSLMDDQTIAQLKTLGANLQKIFKMSNAK